MFEVDILLVEDSASDAELIREAIKDVGFPHRIEVASNGEAAMDLLAARAERPHFIILDLNLPRMSGLDVLRAIKRDPDLRVTPVIILTNSTGQDDVTRCYGNFANAYMRKPVGFDQLTTTLRAVWEFWVTKAVLPRPDSEPPAFSMLPPDDTSDE